MGRTARMLKIGSRLTRIINLYIVSHRHWITAGPIVNGYFTLATECKPQLFSCHVKQDLKVDPGFKLIPVGHYCSLASS